MRNLSLSVLASSFSPVLFRSSCFPPPLWSLVPFSCVSVLPSSPQPSWAAPVSDSNVSRGRGGLSLLIHAVYPGLVSLPNNSQRWHRNGLAGSCPLQTAHGPTDNHTNKRSHTERPNPQSLAGGHENTAADHSFLPDRRKATVEKYGPGIHCLAPGSQTDFDLLTLWLSMVQSCTTMSSPGTSFLTDLPS